MKIFSLAVYFCFLMMTSTAQDTTKSYLALGDSYTVGESVPPQENFPNQTVSLLKKTGLAFAPPVIIAKTGWTTDELENAIEQSNIQKQFDLVTLLIGVNNQYRGRSLDEYKSEFEALLAKAISFAGGKENHVFVVSIPDWGVTPFAANRDSKKIAAEIDAFNFANKLIAEKHKVHYIDITEGSRDARIEKELVAEDGLHPSGKEYGKWAAKLAAGIQKTFQ